MCSCGRFGSECAVDAARRRFTAGPVPYTDTRPEVLGYRIERLVNEQANPDAEQGSTVSDSPNQ